MQSSFRPVAMRLPLSAVAALADVTALFLGRRQPLPRLVLVFRLKPQTVVAISRSEESDGRSIPSAHPVER